ncbi:hypothetical protein H8959_006879 [Pygathrix nigripes]
MQLMELFYSVTMAARIAYSSYIFSLVRPARYQRVAGYSRAAVLLGVFTSSVLGQLLVTVGRVSFSTLNYISLAFLTFSVVLALFLKRPKRSLFFNRDDRERGEASASELERMNAGPGGKLGRALRAACRDSVLARMLRELGDSLRRPQLRLWSLWWVFNSAGYYLVVYYVHILWNEVDPTTNSAQVYNWRGRCCLYATGCHHVLRRGLREDPLGALVQACSSRASRPRRPGWSSFWCTRVASGCAMRPSCCSAAPTSSSCPSPPFRSHLLYLKSSVPWSSGSTRSLPPLSRPSSPSSSRTCGAWASRSASSSTSTVCTS